MNEPNKTFRERLLDMETLSSGQAGTPRDRIRAVLDTRLDVVKRVGFALLSLVGLWTTIVFGSYAFTGDPDDWDAIAIYGILMLFAFFVSLAWTALTGWAAISGTIRRMHRPWIVATTLTMGFCYLVTMMFVFVVPISHEESRAELGTQLALMWFFLLNTIGLCTILGVLYRGQFKSQEKLLEIEYRLAGLAERLDDGKRTDRPVS